MPQIQGGGTVYVGGPGSAKRGPLYIKGGPSSAGSGNPPSQALFYQYVDASGNIVNPTTGSVQWETNIVVPNASVLTLFSVGFPLVAAPGAGLWLEADALILNNIYLTGAFTAGGAIQLNYAAGAVTTPASATIAATFLTSPTVNQMIKVAGSLATIASSNLLNKGLFLTAATQDFASGAGSLIATVRYRVRTGQ